MSFLVRAAALRHLRHLTRPISVSSVQNAAHNYDDFKPGPLPKTKEEHEAAAKKYNLHPSEYRPYPDDDGLGYGDYPRLPDVAVEERDPFYAWDEPALKRNFNEPVHAQIDLISEDRWNISMKPRFTNRQMIGTFLSIMSVSFAIYILAEPYPTVVPVLEKQMPTPGAVHYTFEPNSE